ncbi:MAG: serine/threonine-protein kinase [Sandaracinaceae bacterium]
MREPMHAGAVDIRICTVCRTSYRDPSLRVCPRDGGTLAVWADDPLIGSVLGDRYQIVEPLGQGGMGSVYLAERLPDELEVAVKIVRPEHAKNATVQERFLREVRHTLSVQSPHVVQIFDSGMSPDGRAYMVMERLEGESLTERVRRPPALTPLEALHIAADIGRALDAAHRANVIHRDLKPDNIYLCRDGTLKVVDFGIAKALSGDEKPRPSEPSLTEAHRVVGTPVYMAPEVITKAGLYPQSDLYALGVILYEMLVGEPPFYEKDAVGTMYRHLHETPRRLREIDPTLAIPGALETLVRDLLAKKPRDRPGSAKGVVKRLEAIRDIVRDQPTPQPAEPGQLTAVWKPPSDKQLPKVPTEQPRRRDKRSVLLILLAAILALMLGFAATAAVIYFLAPRPNTVRMPHDGP